ISQIQTLKSNYKFSTIEFADTSLSKYLYDEDVALKLKEIKVALYGEIRAVLSDKKAINMKKAGFYGVQIGIESFSTNVLRLMKKPADLITNIYNLRICYENEIECAYNIILDFPETKRQDILDMINLIPKIVHLTPPTALVKFFLMLNSYVYNNSNKYKLINIRPSKYYNYINNPSITLSYPYQYFDYDRQDDDITDYFRLFNESCQKWLKVYNSENSLLKIEKTDDNYLISDSRTDNDEKFIIVLLLDFKSIHSFRLNNSINPLIYK
ncbi:MAG: hypothetical protein WCH34_19260, partial [Bacteroidota bacterium]